MGRVRVWLLDGFQLAVEDRPIELHLSGQRLVAFLALNHHPLQRSYVAGSLWPDTTEDRARASLRSTLWRLRRLVPGVLAASPSRLWLDPNVWVDLREAMASLEELMTHPVLVTDRLNQLPMTAELLPDWYDPWVDVERERYRQFSVHALESIGQRLADEGLFGSAVQAALAAIASEPLRDSAHRLLMHVYLSEGNRSEAIREYRGYRDLLQKELGVEPPPEIQSLISAPTH